MKLWYFIEAKINKLLEPIFSFIERHLKKLVPKQIKQLKAKPINKQDIAKQASALKMTLQKIAQFLAAVISKCRSFNIKKIKFKSLFILIGGLLAPLLLKTKTWYLSLRPTTIVLFIASSSVIGVAGIGIYTSSKKIAEKSQILVSEPEQVVYKPRAPYHNQDDKQLEITHVNIPVYIGKGNAVRTLIIDFSLQTSNRYIKEYFFQNDHLIKDRLNHSMQEIIPNFPLTLEGQQIIREKIIKEINALIKEQKIKGHIENVFFHSILAG